MVSASPQPPRFWLFTDERLGGSEKNDLLWKAIDRLPEGAGIIFRHYSLPEERRAALFEEVRIRAHNKKCIVLGSRIASPDGHHLNGRMLQAALQSPRPPEACLITAACHSLTDLHTAQDVGADLAFLSPVFPTRSHPDAPILGPERFQSLAAQSRLPVIALGGMNDERFQALRHKGAYGFAAIDYWAQ